MTSAGSGEGIEFPDSPPDTLVLIGTREVPETELEWQRCAAAASRERIDPGGQV